MQENYTQKKFNALLLILGLKTQQTPLQVQTIIICGPTL